MAKRHPPIPADRLDKANRRYRQQLEHPWLTAGLLWLALFVVVVLPIGAGVLLAGGIPSVGFAYNSWTGSEVKGRSSARLVILILGVVLAFIAVWLGFRLRRDRDEIRTIDTDRLADGGTPSA